MALALGCDANGPGRAPAAWLWGTASPLMFLPSLPRPFVRLFTAAVLGTFQREFKGLLPAPFQYLRQRDLCVGTTSSNAGRVRFTHAGYVHILWTLVQLSLISPPASQAEGSLCGYHLGQC